MKSKATTHPAAPALPFPAPPADPDDRARARIVAHAGRVFAERGFRKITIDELCAGLGMSKRTFYQRFENRDRLVEAVLLSTIGPIIPELIQNLDSDRPAREIFDRHFDILLNRLLPSLSMPFLADVQTLMPETWDRIEAFRSAIVAKLVQLLRRGQAEGAFRDDVNPEVIGHIISALMASVANPSFALAHGLSLPATARSLHAVIYRGMLPLEEKRFTTEAQRHKGKKGKK